ACDARGRLGEALVDRLFVLVRGLHASAPSGRKLIREVRERAAREQQAPKSRGVESFDWPGHEFVGLDAAPAVHFAAAFGVFQLGAGVLAIAVLVAKRVGQVLIEAAVPRTLNHAAARDRKSTRLNSSH